MVACVSGNTKGQRSATGKLCCAYSTTVQKRKKRGKKRTKFDRLWLVLFSNDPEGTEGVSQ